MIRATLIAVVALAGGALSIGAQVPTPAPAPVPATPGAKPAQPTPAPRAKRTPALPEVWRSDDFLDLEGRLDAMKDMDLDFNLVTPMPPIEPMIPMDLGIDFDLAPPALAMEH